MGALRAILSFLGFPGRPRPRELGIAAALFAVFFVVYLTVGQQYRTIDGYDTGKEIFFGADHLEAVQGWTRLGEPHYHKGSHPLILLIVVPAGTVLDRVLPSPVLAVLVMTAAFGALTVLLAYVATYLITARAWLSMAIAVFFGLTFSQLVFCAVPETYAIAGASLAFTYVLAIWSWKRRELDLVPWVIAGVLSFAVLITNLAQTCLCFLVLVLALEPKGKRLLPIACFGLLVASIVTLLSIAQKLIFPDAGFFFTPTMFSVEMNYVSPLLLSAPLTVAGEMLKNLFLLNFFGGWPSAPEWEATGIVGFSYYEVSPALHWTGVAAAVIWVAMLLGSVCVNLRDHQHRPLTIALGLIVLFNMALHSLYGTQYLFLYSANFTLAILLLGLSPRLLAWSHAWVPWLAMLVLAAANNFLLIKRLVTTFAGIT